MLLLHSGGDLSNECRNCGNAASLIYRYYLFSNNCVKSIQAMFKQLVLERDFEKILISIDLLVIK